MSKIGKAHWAVKTLICAFSAILFLAFVTGINMQHFSPFTLSRELISPIAVAGNGRRTVMIDDYEKDLLFCDENGRLFKINDLSMPGGPAERAWLLQIIGDSVYVLATDHISGGMYIKSESVLRYDLDGNYRGEVYRQDYSDDEYHERPTVISLGSDGERLLIARSEDSGLSVIRIDTVDGKPPELVKTLKFDKPVSDVTFLLGTDDLIYLYENIGIKERFTKEKDETISDKLLRSVGGINLKTGEQIGNIDEYVKEYKDFISKVGAEQYYFFDDSILSLINVYPVINETDKQIDAYYILNITDKIIYRYDVHTQQTQPIKSLPLHPLLFAWNLLFWLAAAVIVAVLILLVVRLIRKKWSKRLRSFLIVLLVLVTLIVFFSERERNSLIEQYQDTLRATAKQVADSVMSEYSEWFSAANSAPANGVEEIWSDSFVDNAVGIAENINKAVKLICRSQKKESSCYIQVFVIGPNSKVFFVSDSTGFAHLGHVSADWNDIDNRILDNAGNVTVENGTYKKVLITNQLITDKDGNVIGYVEAGNDLSNLMTMLNDRELDLMVNLIALLVMLFILFRVISTFRGDLALYRSQRNAGSNDSGVALAGLYAFLYSFSTRLDKVLLPLLAIRMCRDMPAEQAAMMAAMPITAASIGLWLGTLLFVPMNRWFGERRCAIISQTLCILLCLAEAWCVAASNIYLFTAAKMLFSLFSTGIMYAFRKIIPLSAKDIETRNRAIYSGEQASMAATVLSLLLGGFITQYVNDVTLYIISAALSVLLLLICLFVFPARGRGKASPVEAASGETVHRKKAASVLLLPSILLLLAFVYLPYSLLYGYSEYLFPLYTKSVGISELILSSISVVVLAFNFAMVKSISQKLKRFDRRKVIFMITILPSACMIVSLLSQNIWWSIFCLFMSQTACMQLKVNFDIEVAEQIPEKYDVKSARHCVSIAQSGVDSVVKPLFPTFVPLGHFAGSAILGAISAVLAGLRIVYERVHKRKNAYDRPESNDND